MKQVAKKFEQKTPSDGNSKKRMMFTLFSSGPLGLLALVFVCLLSACSNGTLSSSSTLSSTTIKASSATLANDASMNNASVSFLSHFTHVDKISSTVPGNGDVNPYGVAVVKQSHGRLKQGNILVSNFNNAQNQQGTGTTIVEISPDGTQTVFAQLNTSACSDGIGLTTALVELKRGWVIVGSLPAAGGDPTQAKAGCLIVLNSNGQVVKSYQNQFINGPWDAALVDNDDHATLFVTNALNGTVAGNFNVVNRGSVTRFELSVPQQGDGRPHILASATIATGLAEKIDKANFLLGPTGLGLGKDGTLFIADTINSSIIAIPNALTRQTVSQASRHILTKGGKLNNELGLTIAPNGNILTVNGGDGNIVEITPRGHQIATFQLSTQGAGCLFGLKLVPNNGGVYFTDDCTNQLNILH